jgi:hypothetical protein
MNLSGLDEEHGGEADLRHEIRTSAIFQIWCVVKVTGLVEKIAAKSVEKTPSKYPVVL